MKLIIPIKDEQHLKGLIAVENQLEMLGITFDTGMNLETKEREWELDWSLDGVKVIDKSEMFVNHIEEHLADIQNDVGHDKSTLEVKCKICNKTIDEIYAMELEKMKGG